MTRRAATDLDPATVPLRGRNAIDASAGTGKTHAITRLYLRLVLEWAGAVDGAPADPAAEGGAAVERILVVTYTTAATAELRHRVRKTLADALAALERLAAHGERPVEPVLENFVAPASIDTARRRLEGALSGFDRAAIFTIHSYCQRALAESAFESGRPFECEIDPDEAAILQEVVDDWWRKTIGPLEGRPAQFVVESSASRSPTGLARQIGRYVGMKGLGVLPETFGPPDESPARPDESGFDKAFARCRELWPRDRAAIEELFSGNALNAGRLKTAARERLLAAADAAFAPDAPKIPVALFDKIDCLTAEKLNQLRKKNAEALPALDIFAAVVELIAQASGLREAFARWEIGLRKGLLRHAAVEIRRRRDERGVQSYDDLLLHLHDALGAPGGERLAARLRARFPVALIDEFQDTDPIQFRIFDRIYPRPPHADEAGPDAAARPAWGPLFFVGDPKQAIYGFRRADVFAYLAARDRADAVYELRRNHRSDPALIAAVNAVFAGERPLLLEEITPSPAEAADREGREELVTPDDDRAPLRISFLARPGSANGADHNEADDDGADDEQPRTDQNPDLSTERAQRLAIDGTVREIEALLAPGARARIRRVRAERGADVGDRRDDDGRPVVGSDIAVLVRSNRQARAVRRALTEQGIPSVLCVQDSVFGTETAALLELVLRAVEDPSDEQRLRTALGSSLCGAAGEWLAEARTAAADSPVAGEWQQRAARFHRYHELWRRRGFLCMFRELVDDEGMPARLLGGADGERRLTDLLHLGECLGDEVTRRRLRVEALMTWFAEERRRAVDGDDGAGVEERRLRLESDEDLVQIVTVHKSKGLQYGIVFLPFAWDGALRLPEEPAADPARREPVFFHEVSGRAGAGEYPAVLDFGGDGYGRHLLRARMEGRAEVLRLFYVALTRAKHRCHVFWGRVGSKKGGHRQVTSATSAPAWLFHRHRTPLAVPAAPADAEFAELQRIENIRRAFETLGDTDLQEDLEALRDRADGSIWLGAEAGRRTARPVPWAAVQAAPELAPRTWSRDDVPRAIEILSFTRLADADRPSDDDGRDHDAATDPPPPRIAASDAGAAGAAPAPDAGPGEARVARLPRGLVAGRCLHAIFEELDLQKLPADRAAASSSSRELVGAKLREFNQPAAPADIDEAADAVARTACADLRVAMPGDLRPAGPLRLAGLARERRLRELEFHFPVAAIDPRPFERAVSADPACANLRWRWRGPAQLEGFVKGYVDLVFLGADGRFYIADYKSNDLGDEPGNYVGAALFADLRRHRYPLQSLLYTVALHRLLERRLPGYDPERHLGGSFYLYLRAIGRFADPAAGIAHIRHPWPSLAEVDRALGRSREVRP